MKGDGDWVRGRDLLVKVRNSSRGKSKRSARMRRHLLCIFLLATVLKILDGNVTLAHCSRNISTLLYSLHITSL